MQEKKYNSNKVVDNCELDTGIIKVSIKDGYHNGDVLNLDLSGVSHTWNVEHKEIIIKNVENLNINNILENISLESIEQNDTERFVSVEYITADGENISLKEYALNNQDYEIENFSIEHYSKSNFFGSSKEDVLLDEIFSFDYSESQGADFLESSFEEKIPFEINLEEQGDVYKILKDSFSEGQDFLEIHGYDISQDKVSLEEFAKEFGGAFDYKVSTDNEDLNVNIYSENQEYNIVLKDVISDNDTQLDDIIQNLIINNGESKI